MQVLVRVFACSSGTGSFLLHPSPTALIGLISLSKQRVPVDHEGEIFYRLISSSNPAQIQRARWTRGAILRGGCFALTGNVARYKQPLRQHRNALSALGLPHHSVKQPSGSQSRGMVGEWLGRHAAREREGDSRGEFGNAGV
jgi:hypothetical protein